MDEKKYSGGPWKCILRLLARPLIARAIVPQYLYDLLPRMEAIRDKYLLQDVRTAVLKSIDDAINRPQPQRTAATDIYVKDYYDATRKRRHISGVLTKYADLHEANDFINLHFGRYLVSDDLWAQMNPNAVSPAEP